MKHQITSIKSQTSTKLQNQMLDTPEVCRLGHSIIGALDLFVICCLVLGA
jgi:hypothetical protein